MEYQIQMFLIFVGKTIIAPILIGVAYFLTKKYEKWKDEKRHNQAFSFEHSKDEAICRILIEMLMEFGAGRAFLTLFHNGSTFLAGSNDFKKSRTNEVVARGVNYVADNYQDMRVGLVPEEMDLILQDNPTVVQVEALLDCRFQRMAMADGSIALTRVPVKSGQALIGFIGLDFVKNMPIKIPDLDSLKTYAGLIEQIISTNVRASSR